MRNCGFSNKRDRLLAYLAIRRKLPAVILNDQRLVEWRQFHLIACRQAQYFPTEIIDVHAHPIGWTLRLELHIEIGEIWPDALLGLDRDDIARARDERGDVGFAAVDREMTVPHELPGLRPAV